VRDLEAEIRREKNPKRLRKMATLALQANARLSRELVELKMELARLRGEDLATLELELRFTNEKLAARNRALFGPSSERRGKGSSETPEKRKPAPGHGPTPQPALPRMEEVYELEEADRRCPECGGELQEMIGQFEESEEVDVLERSFRIVVRKGKKYRCRCGEHVETAPGPPKLIPGGRYSIEFAIEVALGKYAYHLPLARQVKQMRREGLEITSQTLWDQLVGLEMWLEPSYEALGEYVLSSPVVGADETHWRLMGKGKSRRWWVWSVTREDAVFYRLLSSRSTQAARDLLGDYHGIVLCDGYSAYSALAKGPVHARDGPQIELAHCWSHVRRKFIEAEPHYPEAGEVLERIGELYRIEREIREAEVSDRRVYTRERRQAESLPIVREIQGWLLGQRPLRKSALGKAVRYTAKIWPGLCRFLEDPGVPIDNNGTEREMRTVALGRKNHYGSRSVHGTRVAGMFYSLIESAELAGVDPRAYLRAAAHRAIAHGGAPTLPHELR
jgi:transposase